MRAFRSDKSLSQRCSKLEHSVLTGVPALARAGEKNPKDGKIREKKRFMDV